MWQIQDPMRPDGGGKLTNKQTKTQCRSGFQFFKLLVVKIRKHCLRDVVNISNILSTDCSGNDRSFQLHRYMIIIMSTPFCWNVTLRFFSYLLVTLSCIFFVLFFFLSFLFHCFQFSSLLEPNNKYGSHTAFYFSYRNMPCSVVTLFCSKHTSILNIFIQLFLTSVNDQSGNV